MKKYMFFKPFVRIVIVLTTLILISIFISSCINNPLLDTLNGTSPTTQVWVLSSQTEVNGNTITQTAKVSVPAFTYSGTFTETSDSDGWWIYDNTGVRCYKLRIEGSIVHDTPGDRWSFVGMTGAGCGMQTLGSNSNGTANGNFPNSDSIDDGVVTITTQTPIGTVSVVAYWIGRKL